MLKSVARGYPLTVKIPCERLMSAFVFDEHTQRLLHYLLAIQHFAEYRVGPPGLTQRLCAQAFQRTLLQTALRYPKFQKDKPHEINLKDIIRFLQKNKHITPDVANKLMNFLEFHNSLYTGVPPDNPEKALEILQFLCAEAKISSDAPNRSFHDIASRKMNPTTLECRLEDSDFDNLDALYPKCFSLQQEIQRKLTVPLKATQPSSFTPNTGGIWIPFVMKDRAGYREPVDVASLGVAFTPLGVRIGLNFGSQAHKDRISYYRLLAEGELSDVLETLHRKATGYCLCDTFWHYHTRNIQSLQWCLTLYESTKVTIEHAIDETIQLQGVPLTGHRFLVSKLVERRPEDFTYVLPGLINEVPKVLDELYPILERISKQ